MGAEGRRPSTGSRAIVVVAAFLAAAAFPLAADVRASEPVITTVAGSPGQGAARSVSMRPVGLALHGIHLLVTDPDAHVVRRVDLVTGAVTVLAGNGGASDDLDSPDGIVVDALANRAYVADSSTHRVRSIDLATGEMTTFAGTGTPGFSGDGGPALQAQLNGPSGLAFKGRDLLVSDTQNSRVRSIGLDTGIITTVAGNGTTTNGPRGDGGLALAASVPGPSALAVDGLGNVFIGSFGEIRKVDLLGLISTFTTAHTGPDGLAVDSLNRLWVADSFRSTVTRYPATGGPGTSMTGTFAGGEGDGGPATQALIANPMGLALDPLGTAYIADTGTYRVRRIDLTGTMTTVAGNVYRASSGDGGPATAAQVDEIAALWADPDGTLFIGDKETGRVRRVAPDGTIGTTVGLRPEWPNRESWATTMHPAAMVRTPAGDLLLAGENLMSIDASGRIRTIPGTSYSKVVTADCNDRILVSFGSGIHVVTRGGRQTLLVGNGNGYQTDDSPALETVTGSQRAIAVDSRGRVVWSEGNRVARLDLDGRVRTIAGGNEFDIPSGIAIDAADNIFVADTGNDRVRRIDPDGTITTVVGGGPRGFFGDGGHPAAASLSRPVALALDTRGNLFVGDTGSRRVRKVAGVATPGPRCTNTLPPAPADRAITTFAGSPGTGPADRHTHSAGAMRVSGTTLYVADGFRAVVRAVDLRTNQSTIVAGNGSRGTRGDGGPATAAQLNVYLGSNGDVPPSLAVGPDGSLYIGEPETDRIRRVAPDGTISTVAGGGPFRSTGNTGAATADIVDPRGLTVGLDGTLYLTDHHDDAIRAVSPSGTITQLAAVDGTAMDRMPNGDLLVRAGPGLQRVTPTGVVTDFARVPAIAFDVDAEGNVYVLTNGSQVVRLDPAGANQTVVAGNGENARGPASGVATEMPLLHARGVAVDDDDNVYISEDSTLRRVTPDGRMATFAGNGDAISGDGGPAVAAQFWHVNDLVVDPAGRLVIGDEAGRVRRVDGDGRISTIAGRPRRSIDERPGNGGPALQAFFSNPRGMGTDAFGNVLVADTFHSQVRRVDTGGTVTKVADVPTPIGVAGDCTGSLWVSSQEGRTVHRMAPTGTELARYDMGLATGGLGGLGGIDVDALGNVYVADNSNSTIHRISPTGTVTAVAGRITQGALYGDGGPATEALLNHPSDVAVDVAGNLWIADTENGRIRRVDPQGVITTVAGFGSDNFAGDGGPAREAELALPHGLALDKDGTLYVSTRDGRVRRIAGLAAGGSPCQLATRLPGVPGGVSAVVGQLSALVSWQAPAYTGTAPIRGYTITVHPGGVTLPAGPSARSLSVPGLVPGVDYTFTVSARNDHGQGTASAPSNRITPVGRSGYWMVDRVGHVFAFGDARHLGALNGARSNVEHIEPTPSGNGYWLLTSAGEVFPYGDAGWAGDPRSGLAGGETATSMSARPAGGYWVFTDRGRVFPYGGAPHLGDMAGRPLNGPVLGSVATAGGGGYYLVASDGGIFAFGDAAFHGSMGGRPLNSPVVGLAPDPDGTGYWLVAGDGGVFAFAAGFRGSMGGRPLNRPVVGMVAYGDGYLMVASEGGIFNFSSKPFAGSLGSNPPADPVVAVAPLAR